MNESGKRYGENYSSIWNYESSVKAYKALKKENNKATNELQ